jgi:hypothetical protein
MHSDHAMALGSVPKLRSICRGSVTTFTTRCRVAAAVFKDPRARGFIAEARHEGH